MAGTALAGGEPYSEGPGTVASPPARTSTTSGANPPSPATASLQNVAARLQSAGQGSSTSSLGSGTGGASISSLESAAASSSSFPSTSLSASAGLPAPTSSAAPLKRVSFNVSKMSIIYPISGAIAPSDEDDTRRRIESAHRQTIKDQTGKEWSLTDLEILYRECCRMREEQPLKKMGILFREAMRARSSLETIDLSFLPLDRSAIDPLADLLSIDFGLQKLVLENCGLADDGVKALLHALLISGTLPNLSLASNRKIRYQGWRYVAIFMRRARALRYLDLSENGINRAALEHIAEAIKKRPEEVTRYPGTSTKKEQAEVVTDVSDASPSAEEPSEPAFGEDDEPLMPPALLLRKVADDDKTSLSSAVISLRLENCGLKGASLGLLAQAVRYSDLKHLSLRRNRINQLGAVAMAVMLKDYPDTDASDDVEEGIAATGRQNSGRASGEYASNEQAATPKRPVNGERTGRPQSMTSNSTSRDYSPSSHDVPMITSSPAGGMTARRMPVPDYLPAKGDSTSRANGHHPATGDDIDRHLTPVEASQALANKPATQSEAEALAIYQAKRAKRILANLPRVGCLLTLDLKSNEIRGGVSYLAQVLRKNRTLRVLNLSDNGIEQSGLVAIADALKYNSTLETLDMSHNPCSGPVLEGITTLRMAFALNGNLKRLFLNDTDMSTEGAIALAEFLPEARSLIHLDLTENFDIDIAGVMALAVSVKLNKSLRCLDLNIPPNDPDFAGLSRDILESCITNTNMAQKKMKEKGIKGEVAAPIYKSVVARVAKEKEREQAGPGKDSKPLPTTGNGTGPMTAEQLVDAAESLHGRIIELLASNGFSSTLAQELVESSKSTKSRLTRVIGKMDEGSLLHRALRVNDDLESIQDRLVKLLPSVDDGSPAESPVPKAAAVPATVQDAQILSPQLSSLSLQENEDDPEESPTSAAEVPTPVAEKEQIRLTDQPTAQELQAETKAKKMVGEEGEIFRKARLLVADEEEDEDEEAGLARDAQEVSGDVSATEQSFKSFDPSSVDKPTSPSFSKTRPRLRSTPSSSSHDSFKSTASSSASSTLSASSSANGGKALLSPEEEQADLPGEELKKRLLQVEVPRAGSATATVEEGSA